MSLTGKVAVCVALMLVLVVPHAFAVTITEYPTPTANSNPVGITAGPDGNLWFTEDSSNANNIGKVTTSGVFTEYPIPNGCCAVFITAAADDNICFAAVVGIKEVSTVS